jgi:nitronate monooxygenase
MAGGPSTLELVCTAAECGALAFVAAGYKTASVLRDELRQVRRVTSRPFGVNLFVPGCKTAHPDEVRRYLETLSNEATRLDVQLGEPEWDDDDWNAKIEVLFEESVDVVSFTFGVPSLELVQSLQRGGSIVAVTVTNVDEARLADEAGVDFLCAQGIEAGAHRGTFTNDDDSFNGSSLIPLLRTITRVTALPLIAAGGVMDASHVRAVMGAGALAAQCGTAFLRCPESGAHPTHKSALADTRFVETVLTRSFSGRVARGLANQFVLDHPDAPPAFPEINNATRSLRSRAARNGDLDRMSLWAGTGFKQASELPVAEVLERLCRIAL